MLLIGGTRELFWQDRPKSEIIYGSRRYYKNNFPFFPALFAVPEKNSIKHGNFFPINLKQTVGLSEAHNLLRVECLL